MTVGEKMRWYRKRLNLSQENVAQVLQCQRATYTYYERDKTNPDLERLWRISKLLQFSIDQLLDPDFDPELERIRRYKKRLREQQRRKDR